MSTIKIIRDDLTLFDAIRLIPLCALLIMAALKDAGLI